MSFRLVLGTQVDKGERVVLTGKDAARHMHLIATTGAGKSKLLSSLFLQILNQGNGVALIDPAGDVCSEILGLLHDTGYFLDQRAYRRLYYIPFGRKDAFLPFNVLNQPYEVHQIASDVLESWKRAWHSISGGGAPQLENIVLASCCVLSECHLPLTAMSRLLSDRSFREELLENVSDPEIVSFFRVRFDGMGKFASQASADSSLRRVFLLTFDPALRYSLGQLENVLQLRTLMDTGVSLLFDLSGLSADAQRFLGCLLTVGFEQAALSRANTPEDARHPYVLMLDEF